MSDYYAVAVRATFSILASSPEEADALVRELVPDEIDYPARANYDIKVYRTLNQSDDIKRYAVNYHD